MAKKCFAPDFVPRKDHYLQERQSGIVDKGVILQWEWAENMKRGVGTR